MIDEVDYGVDVGLLLDAAQLKARLVQENRSSDCCKALMPVTGVSPSLRWVASEETMLATRS